MKLDKVPVSSSGKWSLGLFSSAIVFFGLSYAVGGIGEYFELIVISNAVPRILLYITGLCGISSSITGIIGIVSLKDRSILVYLTTFLGFGIFLSLLLAYLINPS